MALTSGLPAARRRDAQAAAGTRRRPRSRAARARVGRPPAGSRRAVEPARLFGCEAFALLLDSLPLNPLARATEFSWQLSEAERRQRFEQALPAGDLVVMLSQLWADQGGDLEGNALAADLLRGYIGSVVKDLATAEALTPRDYPFGSKRPCLETGYYATFNRANVSLVNLRQEPIDAITAAGIRTGQ